MAFNVDHVDMGCDPDDEPYFPNCGNCEPTERENERLREALHKIATYAEPEYRDGWKERYHVAMSRIAADALGSDWCENSEAA
ncbi:MAG: hypothetical protein MSG64_16810 [Pyrinomonadaceae bacterium MAG19_C2-C3]|nr:hypothetical protein [Pyrinomonadaceae bacterium MAG19_C2-C3]